MGAEAIPAQLRDLVGGTLADGYRLDEIIGSGGMGVVFAAQQLKLRREVAIKILDPAVADAARARRFRREAESVARLDHVNCLQVFDFGTTDDGLHFMVMPRLQGHTLSRLLREENLSPRRALELVVQILAGLEHAHGQGLIHRDLKPANIFLVDAVAEADAEPAQIVKIVDFGIAKIIDTDADASFQTRAGVMFGTPAYMSPEQAVGEPVDARSDLYALGIVLYRMIGGTVPHRGKTVIDQMRKRATLEIPALPSPVPAEVSEFMQWLCARDIDARCPSAAQARRRAQALLDGAPADSAAWNDPLPEDADPTPGEGTVLERSMSVTRLDAYLEDAGGASSIQFPTSTPSPSPGGSGPAAEDSTRTLLDPDMDRDADPRPVPRPPRGKDRPASSAEASLEWPAEEAATVEDAPPVPPPPLRRRWPVWSGVAVLAGVVAVAAWPRDTSSPPQPANDVPESAPPASADPPERPVDESELPGGTTGERFAGDESPPPPPNVDEPDLLEKLTRVNTRDPKTVLAFAERHAILDELRADPRAATLVDENANAVWDLEQADEAPQPCAAFVAAFDRIEGSSDRWVRRGLRRAVVPDSEEAACRSARRRVDALRSGSKNAEPSPEPAPTTEDRPKVGEVTPKLGGLK